MPKESKTRTYSNKKRKINAENQKEKKITK